VRLNVKVTGIPAVRRNLRRMADTALDASSPLLACDEILAAEAEASFARQGPGWEPLAPATVDDRVRRGYPPAPILTRSGRLRRSYAGGAEHRLHATHDTLEFGSDVDYAAFHQTGTRAMPARRVHISEVGKREVVRVIQRWLVEEGNGER